jgi:hypothetical protein
MLPQNSPKRKFVDPARAPRSNKSSDITFKFTDDKVYDLNEIIYNIRRDNSELALVIKVNTEEAVNALTFKAITDKIIQDYFSAVPGYTKPTTDESRESYALRIPAFEQVFNIYFRRYYLEYSEDIKKSNREGSISIDEKIGDLSVTTDDIDKYLTDYTRSKKFKVSQSIYNLNFKDAGTPLTDADTPYANLYDEKPSTGITATEVEEPGNVEFTDL